MKIFLFLLYFYVLCLSCGQDTRAPQNNHEPIDPSCTTFSLIGDFTISYSYVSQVLTCINQSSPEGGLPNSLALLAQLSEQPVEDLLDLAFTEHPDSQVLGVKYPYLAMAAVVLDRGRFSHSGHALVSTESRFGGLQQYLLDIDPSQSAQLVLHWAKSGQLDTLIADGIRLLDQLPDGLMTGYLRKALTEEEFQNHLKVAAKDIFDSQFNYDAVRSALTLDQFQLISSTSSADCLDDPDLCVAVGDKQDFTAHWRNHWASLSPEQQNQAIAAMSSIFLDSIATDQNSFSFYLRRFASIVKNYLLREKAAAPDLARLLTTIQTTQLKQLNPLMAALQKIRDNPTYFDALLEKSGSTNLQQDIEEFMWNGGTVEGCGDFPGFRHADSGWQAVQDNLHHLLSPNPSCNDNSLLASYILAQLNLSCTGCTISLPLADLEDGEITPRQWSLLMNHAIDRIAYEIATDPHYLRSNGLAYAAIEEADLLAMQNLLVEFPVNNFSDYFEFTAQIEQHPVLRVKLSSEFFDRWLNMILEDLSTTAFSFQNLFANPQGEGGYKLDRVLHGIYPLGPVATKLKSAFAPGHLEIMLPDEWDLNAQELSYLFYPATKTESFFKNALVSFKGETEGFAATQYGSIQNPVTVDTNGQFDTSPSVLTDAAIFVTGDEDSWSQRGRFWDTIPITTASLDLSVAQKVSDWALSDLKSQIETPEFWNAIPSRKPLKIPYELFSTSSYSAYELEKLTYYVTHKYLSPQFRIPAASWQQGANRLNRNAAIRGFFNASAISGSDQAWLAYQAIDHKLIKEGSFASLVNQWQTAADRIDLDLKQRRGNPLKVTQGEFLASDFATLTSHEKELLLLQGVSFIYNTRQDQFITPTVNYGDHCSSRDASDVWQPALCPGNLANSQAYLDYLAQRSLEQICPYFDAKVFSSGFSEQWRTALGFKESLKEIETICAPAKLPLLSQLSTSALEGSLQDLLNMGKNPSLAKELKRLPHIISFQRHLKRANNFENFRFFISSTPVLKSETNAILNQRQGLYASFKAKAPNLIDFVIADLAHQVGLRDFSAALIAYSADGSAQVAPLQRLVDYLLLGFDESIAADESLLAYSSKIAMALGQDPELGQAFLSMTIKNHDPYSGILMGYTIPQAVKARIFANFTWDNPDYFLVKEIFKPNHLLTLQGFIDAFDTSGDEVFKSFYRAVSNYGGRESFAEDMNLHMDFLRSVLLGSEIQTGLSQDWRSLAQLNLSPDASESVSYLALSTKAPLADLNNQWQPSVAQNITAILPVLLTDGLQFFEQIQSASPQSPVDFNQVMSGMISQNTGTTASQEAFKLLQDQRLGLRQPRYWHDVLSSPPMRLKLQNALQAIEQSDCQFWQGTIDELAELLPEIETLLTFALKNGKFDPEIAKDATYIFETLSSLSAEDGLLLQNQTQLLDQWMLSCSKEGADHE